METSEHDKHEMETAAQSVAQLVGGALPSGVLFALMVFTAGSGGWATWVSNANRADMVKAIREMADRLERGEDRQ